MLSRAFVDFATAQEIDWPRDPQRDSSSWGIHLADPAPYNVLRGPVHARGPAAGVVWHRGHDVGSWGEPDRADLTFSVAKSYLALLAGVAHDRGLMPDPDEAVGKRVPNIGFDSEHNRSITWTHLLQQTSEWEGRCFGLPDTVDRYRVVAHGGELPPEGVSKGDARPLRAPGTHWEYNDVRINQLSLALLHLFGQPLPEVFDEAVMRPLQASTHWRWVGYDDAWVDVPDRALGGVLRRMPSVPGGTHWGGGVSIAARDQARIGYLLQNDGLWQGTRVLSQAWARRMRKPCPVAPWYGMLLWLNSATQPVFSAASPSSVFMIGAGGHLTWMEPERDLVVVLRWTKPEAMNDVMSKLLAEL